MDNRTATEQNHKQRKEQLSLLQTKFTGRKPYVQKPTVPLAAGPVLAAPAIH